MKKFFIIILIIFVLVAIFIYFQFRSTLKNPRTLVDKLPDIAKNLDFQLDDVRYTHSRSGQKKWELKAHKAIRHKNSNTIVLQQIEAWIYPIGRLEGPTHITADSGSYEVNSGNISLSGNILIDNKDFSIATTALQYDEHQNMIVAPKNIHLANPKLSVSAGKALIDLKSQRLTFTHRVNTTINLARMHSTE